MSQREHPFFINENQDFRKLIKEKYNEKKWKSLITFYQSSLQNIPKNDFYLNSLERLKGIYKDSYLSLETSAGFFHGSPAPSLPNININIHHTYGVPFIQSSSIKSCIRSYAEAVLTNESDLDFINRLLGSEENSGALIIMDALPSNGFKYLEEISNPHHADYYATGGQTPALDTDSPSPHKVLSVIGEFNFFYEIQEIKELSKEKNIQLREITKTLIKNSLKFYGLGAKKSSSYGRFHDKPYIPSAQVKKTNLEVDSTKGPFDFS